MAPHSSTLTWKIPWTEAPGRLQSMGSWRVGHNWPTSFSLFTFLHWRRQWQPTPVFLPGEAQGWESLVGCHPWGRAESDMIEALYQQSKKKSQMIISRVKGKKLKNSAPIILKILSKLGLGRNFLHLKKNISRTCPPNTTCFWMMGSMVRQVKFKAIILLNFFCYKISQGQRWYRVGCYGNK